MACNRKGKEEPKEILGLNRITKKRLLELCKKNKLYQTPSLNDVLYLHYQGFQAIECLEEYTELKCLWLECNAISEIQGLENQIKLKCLFLQSNLIKKIENLEYCKELDTINLSQNHIRKIENCGIDKLPVLNTLNIASNYIKDCEGLKELVNCMTLSVLDLSNNRIDDILVVKIFNKMPELKVLVLQGNPVVSKIPQYRKTLTLECKKLTYLDSRPVFPKDRACAEAWKRGGYEEERKENERWNRRERKKMRDSVNATIRMRNRNRRPEDMLTLLTSSDSEDDSSNKKTKRQNDLAAAASLDSIWDEVAEDSSDLNVSTSTSETSTTDSNGQGNSSDGCIDNTVETSKIDEEKILNDCFENNKKVCHSAENKVTESGKEKEIESIELKNIDKQTIKRAEQEDEGMEIKSKKIKIDHEDENIDESEKDLNVSSSSSLQSNNSLYSDKDQYKETVDAISHVTMNNLSDTENLSTTPLRSVQLQIETINAKDDEIYEPLTELEETMNKLTRKEDSEIKATRLENFSSLNEQTMLKVETPTEEECLQLNHQLKKDFDKLSSDMDNFMLQLQKNKDERQEAMGVVFDKKESSKENSSSSSESESEENLFEWKVENMVDQWERATRLVKGKRLVKTRKEKNVPEIWINDRPCQEEEEENFEESGNNSQNGNNIYNEREEEIKTNFSEESFAHKSQNSETLIYQQENKEVSSRIKEETLGPPAGNKTGSNKEQQENQIDALTADTLSPIPGNADDNAPESPAGNETNSNKEHHENQIDDLTADTSRPISVDAADDPNEFEYIPMDITLLARNSHYALNSIEKEAKELKVLLKKLEDENMDLFNEINTETKCDAEEHAKENRFKDDEEVNLKERDNSGEQKNNVILQENETEQSDRSSQQKDGEEIPLNSENDSKIKPQENFGEQIMESLERMEILKEILEENEMSNETLKPSIGEEMIEEIIYDLELKSYKPKSFEFDIISDEEYSYTETKEEQEDLPGIKTIPDFLETFTMFSKTISKGKRIPNERRKLQDFNSDTHESLDEQLQQLKEEQTKQIRRMVDRVYAQKERYDDTLELIDGKLMVRNKDTGEVKELPAPSRRFSDSDTEYDTAQSEEETDEEEGACFVKPRQLIEERQQRDHSLGFKEGNWGFTRHDSNSWPILHKPIERQSTENLINKALAQDRKGSLNRNPFNESDESSDEEFYSLDPQNKQNLYGNIDKDFFSTLNLDNLKLSAQDENHMQQCAQSYEDMRKCLKLTTSNENNKLIDNIEEQLSRQSPVNLENDGGSSDDLLLKKLMQRTKEKEGFEKRKINKEAIKLFEYKNENNDSYASSSNSALKSLNEIDNTPESNMDNITEIFDNNVYTFIFEEPEETIKKEKEEHKAMELDEIECEENRQDFIKNLLLRDISLQKVKTEEEKLSSSDLNSPKSADSLVCPENYSEEEKNEIESNVDVEGIAMHDKLDFVTEKKYLEETLNNESLSNTAKQKDLNATFEFEFNTQSSEVIQLTSSKENYNDIDSAPKTVPDCKNIPMVFNETYLPEQQDDLDLPDLEEYMNIAQYRSETPVNNSNPINCKSVNPPNNTTEVTTQSSNDSDLNNQQSETELPTSGNSDDFLLSFSVDPDQKPSENLKSTESLQTSELEVLECNLEILGSNDDIIDTITVNAELHYEY